jgi:hypothetical protein
MVGKVINEREAHPGVGRIVEGPGCVRYDNSKPVVVHVRIQLEALAAQEAGVLDRVGDQLTDEQLRVRASFSCQSFVDHA